MISIRQATLLDLLNFAKLGQRYSEEAAKHENFPYDTELALENAAKTIMHEDGCFIVAYDDKEPVGFLWGCCSSLPWSKARLAFDTILYVLPEYRGSSVGYRLMMEWERWSIDKGAVEVQISIASGVHEDKTEDFYKKLGYHYVGSQYRKEIKDGFQTKDSRG